MPTGIRDHNTPSKSLPCHFSDMVPSHYVIYFYSGRAIDVLHSTLGLLLLAFRLNVELLFSGPNAIMAYSHPSLVLER